MMRRNNPLGRFKRSRCPTCGKKFRIHTKHPTEPHVVVASCGKLSHAVKFRVADTQPWCAVCLQFLLGKPLGVECSVCGAATVPRDWLGPDAADADWRP